jgi:hypothetical protein
MMLFGPNCCKLALSFRPFRNHCIARFIKRYRLFSSHTHRLGVRDSDALHNHRCDSGRLAPDAFAFQDNVLPVHSAPAVERAISFSSPARVISLDLIEWDYLDLCRLGDADWVAVSVDHYSKVAHAWKRLAIGPI